MALELLAKGYNRVMGLLEEEKGQGMVEYGLILALVAVVAIAGLMLIGGRLYQSGLACTDPNLPVFNAVICKLGG